jgi:O-antigen/teichoic acid export membrane protein
MMVDVEATRPAQTSRLGRVLKNAAFVGIAQFGTQALLAITAICIVRYLGLQTFNKYATAMLYMGGFAIFARMGFNRVFLRECSKDLSKTAQHYGAALLLNVTMTVLAIVVALAIAYYRYDQEVFVLIVLIGWSTMLLSSTQTPRIVFQVHQQLHIPSAMASAACGLYAVAVLTGIYLFHVSVVTLAVMHLAMNLLHVSALCLASLKFAIPRLDRQVLRTLFLAGIPFCIIDIMMTAYTMVHGFTLAIYDMGDEVSYFRVPYRIFALFQMVAQTVDIAIAPALYAAADAPERMLRGIRLVIRYFTVSGLFVAAIMITRPQWLLTTLFTSDFVGGADVCRLMGLAVAFRFIVILFSHVLYAKKRERFMMCTTGILAVLSIPLCLLIVPEGGALGAATLMTAAEAVYCVACLVKCRGEFPGAGFWKLFLMPVAAAGLTTLFLHSTPSQPVLSLAVSPFLFVGILWMTRYYRIDELVSFLRAIRRRRPAADE